MVSVKGNISAIYLWLAVMCGLLLRIKLPLLIPSSTREELEAFMIRKLDALKVEGALSFLRGTASTSILKSNNFVYCD